MEQKFGITILDREKRLRRCLLICCHFARNLAYYRARREVALKPIGDFWISADANFIDIAILEWCKILGDNRAEQGWAKIVTQPDRFQTDLLVELGLGSEEWAAFVAHVRHYRDKFIAHPDSDLIMNIPNLDQALRAASFYYRWILVHEFCEFNSKGIPKNLMNFYSERFKEAIEIYITASGIENHSEP